MPDKSVQTLMQVKVSLVDSKPLIWRRLKVDADTSLALFHVILQIAMGWEEEHLHEFVHGKQRYGMDDPFEPGGKVRDEYGFTLADLLKRKGSKLTYLYDFGDNWEHLVELEAITTPKTPLSVPQVTAAARACPPEDCGGIPGYTHMLKILRKPTHEEYDEIVEWLGDDFDPAAFDKEAVNVELSSFFNKQRTVERLVDLLDDFEALEEGDALSEAEERHLFDFFPLEGIAGNNSANYDALLGYLNAIVLAPGGAGLPQHWLLELHENYRLDIEDEVAFSALMRAIYANYRIIRDGYEIGEHMLPRPEDLRDIEPGTGAMELWCEGFLHGFVQYEEEWFELDDDDALLELESCATMITVMATRDFGDLELTEHEALEKLQQIQQHLPMVIDSLQQLSQSEHYAPLSDPFSDPFIDDLLGEADSEPAVSTKIGRNEPCPCGSGLKYKKCCIDKVVPFH